MSWLNTLQYTHLLLAICSLQRNSIYSEIIEIPRSFDPKMYQSGTILYTSYLLKEHRTNVHMHN